MELTITIILGLFFAAWLALIWHHRRVLHALWREPVLRRPVLIIESDDWGPGPKSDAQQLHRIAQLLARHRDSRGHTAVMTLGMVLAVPDTQRIRSENYQCYHRVLLVPQRFPALREVMQCGVSSGVFALQLHGMEHYWPPALMMAARADASIQGWLEGDDLPRTEELPSHLQSRWIDAATLPSQSIGEAEIKAAVREEVDTFTSLFGQPPRVVVPPTFVWNETVERAWATAGVEVIVTPGQRYEARDQGGMLVAGGGLIRNGDLGMGEVRYVVRDDYFEPALGHAAEKGWAALRMKSRAGRPTLLETHRFNFSGDPDVAEAAIHELDRLLAGALERFPGMMFLSTEQLVRRMCAADAELVETGMMRKMGVWLLRLREVPRLYKLAWLTGVIVPASLLFFVTRLFRADTSVKSAVPAAG
ncbi:MAG: glycosyl hydrolase [Gammaproteobacteria bacterium]|nr:glycosyl hydrolase [Gammaproteobacteria bacterium]